MRLLDQRRQLMTINTVIHTIRHGHTAYNAEKRYAGSIDIPLSEKGVIDCGKASSRLREYHFDIIITSQMKRAKETAQLLEKQPIQIIQNALCNERNFGIMEGHTWDEVLKFEPPVMMIDVGNDLHTVNPKGGEPFEDVWERAIKFRRFLFNNYKDKSVLVVSHGVFLQMFHGCLRGLSCIESLAFLPSNLELASFYFSANHLLKEKVVKLLENEPEVKF
jgi:2,3-bisphosphoglycerate-dependent phosphoglycerate mutase